MVQDFLTRANPKQKKDFMELRSTLLALPEVEESLEIDELKGDWCPVYRVRGKDLVWVHFGERMFVNVPIEAKFEKKAFEDENLDDEVVESIKEAEDVGDMKWATVELRSSGAVESLFPLLKLRHSFLRS